MFSWNFAKSAEAMFSPWAMKKLCKGFLKKALGNFILGEIDLNQLDIQLSAGTIQLYDLALNVDYINQELGASKIIVKEGSIGSLLVQMSWKGAGSQIVLDELEIIVAPCVKSVHVDESKTTAPCENSVDPSNHDPEKIEQDRVASDMLSSVQVHEGVKTVAKMVNQLLSSFQVKISKLIVAFDPSGEKEKNNRYCRTLVLRIAEIECKTRISEDAQLQNEPTEDDILGLNQLTHSLEFQGAIIEFLQMDGTESRMSNSCPPELSFRECLLGRSQATAMTQIVTGENGGFSGHLNLSIPWKNGFLDIYRVDADAHIKPLNLRFQPSTVICFIYLWEILKKESTGTDGQTLQNLSDSVYNNGRSFQNSSTPGPCSLRSDNEHSSINYSSCNEEEYGRDALISESHLISDWVGRNQKEITRAEPDFGASVDQFFECFDELRSSQSSLSNSGMWNWTRSVFTAITAASNLASGSVHIPLEQQHVERTNLKVTIDKISLLFSFSDEDPVHSVCTTHDQAKADSNARYLGADFCGELLLQVSPEQMNFEATVKDVKIDDYFSPENDMIDPKSHGRKDCIKSQAGLISKMQDGVQNSLAPFCSSSEYAWLFGLNGYDAESKLSLDSKSDIQNINRKGIYRDDVVKVSLLKTLGNDHCRITVNSKTSDNGFVGLTSFTLKLPPFILWVNFGIIDLICSLLKQIESSQMSSDRNDAESGVLGHRRSYSRGNEAKGSCSHSSTISTNETLTGNISLSNARIIFCFPYKNGADSGGYPVFDQFIALQFSSLIDLGHSNVETSKLASLLSSRKVNMLPNSRSLDLTLGSMGAYFITSDTIESVAGESHSIRKLKFFAQKVMSLGEGSRSFSAITMYWQDGALTGPQVINKAKILATAGNRTRTRFKGEDYEFASVSTVKDMEDFNTLTRQEIISSSSFCVHARLCPVNINLEKVQYNNLLFILHQLNDVFSCMASDPVNQKQPSQGSVLVECDLLGISVSMEIEEAVKGSIQKELPGSWHSFKLKIQNFEFLSVSNIGGMKDASFIWVNHQEGSLLGSVTGVPHKEMLLISCSNSTMGRGDGEGLNILSPRFSGSDIVYLLHPEDIHSYMSIAVRGGTIVGTGGRLDWWDALSSFFIPPSPEIDPAAGGTTLQKDNSEINRSCGSSFVLNLVDVALSYEPYFYDHVDHKCSPMEPCSACPNAIDSQFFACLLAVSSLRISNTSVSNSSGGEFKIQIKNLGFLLCAVSGPQVVGGIYDVDHLRSVGYLKIAQGACFEALLRTFSDQDLVWEVESSDSQIALNTCYDTTAGLIQLCAQLQQLFAPDVEDAVVHLQNRWNNVKGENGVTGNKTFDGDTALLDPILENVDTRTKPNKGNLLDEICEDEFLRDASNYQDHQFHMSSGDSFLDEPIYTLARNGEDFSGCLAFGGSLSDLENDGVSNQPGEAPELIEDYFLPGLRPLSELSLRSQSSSSLDWKISNLEESPTRNARWYGETFQRIRENHVLDKEISVPQLEDTASCSHTETDEYGKINGRVVLKNMNIVWRMYSGSDWHNFKKPYAVSFGRDTTVCLEFSLSGMKIQYDIFPDGGICVSRLSLSIQDIFMSDNSKNAPWKLVLGYYQSKDHPRESFSKAFKLDLESVRPDPSTPLEEYRLRVALLPMRLHLHQSQLDFLINFFGGASVESSQSDTHDFCEQGKEMWRSSNSGGHVITEEALLPYFQKFDIKPVLIRVDYSPSRVDLAALRSGKYVELVNLVPWKGVELQLKHVHAVGIYGWSCVCETVIGEWLEDISQTQVHKLLKGLPPIRSLVAVSSGAAKLVTLPVKNYRKDKRLLKGIQRGTVAFLRSISLEAIGLGVHLAAGAHDILLHAEYILTGIPPAVSWNPHSRGNINVRSNQPKDARQGIKQACESISDGIGKSASALVHAPLKSYQRDGGVGSAFATAVRAAPVAAIAPASAAARAMHYAFLGVRNSLDAEHKKESLEKYLGATQHRESCKRTQP